MTWLGAGISIHPNEQSGVNLRNELVHFWDLDSGAASELDLVGATDLLESGTVEHLSAAGPGSKDASGYDATGDYYDIGSTTSLANYYSGFTLSVWACFTAAKISSHIAIHDNYFVLKRQSSKFRIVLFDDVGGSRVVQSLANTLDGTWFHLVATNDSNGLTLYQDGVFQGTDSNVLGAEVSAGNVGRIANGLPTATVGKSVNGRLAMLGLWNRVLTAEEITRLYNSGSGLNYSDM